MKNLPHSLRCAICLLLVVVSLLTLTACGAKSEDSATPAVQSVSDLSGARIGVLTGSVFDVLATETIPDCTLQYYNEIPDMPLALQDGKIDAYVEDEPVARLYCARYPDMRILEKLTENDYGYIFKKDDARGTELCRQMNEFLAASKENGLLEQIDAKWFGSDEDAKTVDYSRVADGENGILVFATSATCEPFEYIKDGVIVGYDVDLAVAFCEAYGYGMRVDDYSFSALLGTVQSGLADFSGACITITDERKESMLFSDPNYSGGAVVVVRDTEQAAADDGGFWASVKESFDKTFLREDRWQLFAEGVGITLLITVASVVFGSLLGFGVYLGFRKKNRIFNSIVRVISTLIHGTPEVVFLMILYYLILGQLGMSNLWIAIVGFTLIFAGSVLGMLQGAVNAIDPGQYEAAFALGYGDTKSFLRIIFPQAAAHFLPVFRGEVVSLLKGTAIVGYVAVADLTRVSDIVRSRTYEAFFPLIATAVIYFLLEGILIFLVSRIQLGADFRRRTPEKILKGVQTK